MEKNKHIKYKEEDRLLALKASAVFRSQKNRCESVNSHAYYLYGKKGIKVIYDRRKFVNWYVETAKSANINIQDIVVGRIDHDKDYCFENIRMETKSYSSNEMLERTGWRKKIIVCDELTGNKLFIADSQKEASLLTGINFKTINSQLRNPAKFKTCKTKHGYRFSYLGEKNEYRK